MFLCGLMATAAASHFQPYKAVGGSTTKAKQIAVQPAPKVDDTTWGKTGCQFHCQRTMTGPDNILAELLLVWGENADSASPSRNGHVPLLGVGRGFHCRIRKQDVIHGLAL
jgi:hypothetical protein